MKNMKITPRILLGVALLGTFVVAPLATLPVQADPPRHAPAYGRRAKDEGKKYKKEKKEKKDKRDERNDNYDRGDHNNNNDNNNNNGNNNNNNYNNNVTYTGVVTSVRGNGFDLRANGRTYNVYTTSIPRALNRGDEVRVSGRLINGNDIRNASVQILRNGGGNGGGNGTDGRGNYRTVDGIVTSVRNSREFDVRVGNTIYNVYAASSTSGLNVGDGVRVYGRLEGARELRDATVRFTQNRPGNTNNAGYSTYRGQVVNVRNSREFDVRINGKTYNVYAVSSTRGLSVNDEVSVYGMRSGANDIRDARVSIIRNR